MLTAGREPFVETMVAFAMSKYTEKGIAPPTGVEDELREFYTIMVDQLILLIQSGDIMGVTTAVTGTAGTIPVVGVGTQTTPIKMI